MLLPMFEVGNPYFISVSNPSLITTAFGSSLLMKWRLINLISLNFLGLVCFAGGALTKSLKENELIKAPSTNNMALSICSLLWYPDGSC